MIGVVLAIAAILAIIGAIIYGLYYGIRECYNGDCTGLLTAFGPVMPFLILFASVGCCE